MAELTRFVGLPGAPLAVITVQAEPSHSHVSLSQMPLLTPPNSTTLVPSVATPAAESPAGPRARLRHPHHHLDCGVEQHRVGEAGRVQRDGHPAFGPAHLGVAAGAARVDGIGPRHAQPRRPGRVGERQPAVLGAHLSAGRPAARSSRRNRAAPPRRAAPRAARPRRSRRRRSRRPRGAARGRPRDRPRAPPSPGRRPRAAASPAAARSGRDPPPRRRPRSPGAARRGRPSRRRATRPR